jgi:hypothetical protein
MPKIVQQNPIEPPRKERAQVAPQLGVVKMEEVTEASVLLDFLKKTQWAKTMVEVNLAAATAVELLSQIGPQG